MINYRQGNDHSLQQAASRLVGEIANCLRANGHRWSETEIVTTAYLSYIASRADKSDYETLLNTYIIQDDTVKQMIRNSMPEAIWASTYRVIGKNDPELFRYIVLTPDVANVNTLIRSEDTSTPESIISLVSAICEIKANDSVADIGCGKGTYLLTAAEKQPHAHYYGYEINPEASAIAAIRTAIAGGNIRVYECDAFKLLDDTTAGKRPEDKFDFIFSNYPFGMRIRDLRDDTEIQALRVQYPGLGKATSADWFFHALISNLLRSNGKAACITTNGSTSNTSDEMIRKQFVEDGRIEAVIALPNRLYNYTGIGTTLMILSQGNKDIRFIDATELYSKGRRINTFDAQHIEMIVKALTTDSDHSISVSIETIRENDYALTPGWYLQPSVAFEDGVPFESVIAGIRRGAACSADELDAIVSHTPTNMQCLMLNSIRDGIIDENLPYLSEIDPKYDKYCVRSGNLIISKNGFPTKIAVAQVEKGKRILAHANLYIIDLNEERIDPYYIKAFLESEQGKAQLAAITVGATIPSIGVDRLKKMIVPLPPMEKQKRIAKAYIAAQNDIAGLRTRLEIAQNMLSHIYDSESEK